MVEGILLLDKPPKLSSFALVHRVRQRTGEKKVGHAGTLDPFATGVMVLLVGRRFTRMSDQLLGQEKEYLAELYLGVTTDSFDCTGVVTGQKTDQPTLLAVEEALTGFQGTILQTPPMFSAKKQQGQKLYHLARRGIIVDRPAVPVTLHCTLLSYDYPQLCLHVRCSKGTYIRSLADDLGRQLGSGAHLSALKRIRSGLFSIEECHSLEEFTIDHLLGGVPCVS